MSVFVITRSQFNSSPPPPPPPPPQLTEHKERCEKALEAKALPLDVVLECLSLREQRVSIDLVRDDVEAELHTVSCYGTGV